MESNTPKVTIIMPSLNVVNFISECIESVINQTLSDIEILCIDAGSTDGTLEILRDYESKDNRIKVVVSPMKSYGHQVNMGLDMARGEYVGIVETDDYIEHNMYEELYQAAIANQADFVKSDFDVFITSNNNQKFLLRYSLKQHMLDMYDDEVSYNTYTSRIGLVDIYIWNGIYNLSFLKEHHIRLNETPGAAYQDCGFRYLVAMNVNKGIFLDKSFYRYRRDNVGSSVYSTKCVGWNLGEFMYIRKVMEETGINDARRQAFIARETVGVAVGPYSTLRKWHESNEEIKAAQDKFRDMIRKDRENGLLRQEDMLPTLWLEMRLFTEKPEVFEEYISVKAEMEKLYFQNFINKMSTCQEIVVFCTGKAASCALCVMKMNGINSIKAFCDNNQEKWGSAFGGYDVLSPQEAVLKYPNAHFLIASAKYGVDILKQLKENNIPESNISIYKLILDPMESTNKIVNSKKGDL